MQVNDLQVVLKVAEFKSIKKAAESLDLSTATASAALFRVEKHFGIELFQRTTRQLKVSNAGEKHIPQIEQAILLLSQIEQNAKSELDIIDGALRLAAPSDFGRNLVLDWVNEFLDIHPKLSLKFHVSDSNIDFYRAPVDVALRYGAPKDSGMYGFKICDVPRVLCASPAYIEQYGKPASLQELESHNGLCYQLHDIVHDVWEFSQGDEIYKVKMQSNRVANDAELVRRWCVAGKGVAVKSVLDMSSDLINGNLETLLPNFTPVSTELWLICPSRQLITPAIRTLRTFITERCTEVLKELEQRNLL